MTRRTLAVLLVVAGLVAGCGGAPPPDDATSRTQITRAVLAWHRYQADANGRAGLCAADQAGRYAQGGDDCARSIERYSSLAAPIRQALRDAKVDKVTITGDKATVVTHTTATEGGVTRKTPPATIPLRWERGRWRVD